MRKSLKIIIATVTIVLTLVTFAANAFALNSDKKPNTNNSLYCTPFLTLDIAIATNQSGSIEKYTFQGSTYVDIGSNAGITNSFDYNVPYGRIREIIEAVGDTSSIATTKGHSHQFLLSLDGGSPTGTFTQNYYLGNYTADDYFVQCSLPLYTQSQIVVTYFIDCFDSKGVLHSYSGTKTVLKPSNIDTIAPFNIPIPENEMHYISCAKLSIAYTNDDPDLFLDNQFIGDFYLPVNNTSEMDSYFSDVVANSRDFSVTGFLADSLSDFFGADLFGNISLGEIFFALIGLLCIIAFLKYIAGG